jgi:hypothetical protein
MTHTDLTRIALGSAAASPARPGRQVAMTGRAMTGFTLALPNLGRPRTGADDVSTMQAVYTFGEGIEVRHIVLPVDGCPAALSGDVPEDRRPTAPGEHVWTTPINCFAHDFAHLAGIGCTNCGEHHFFVLPCCPDEDE